MRWLWLPWNLAGATWALIRLRSHGTSARVMVFTHYHDIDATGKDRQMGPLVDALIADGVPVVEVTLVPVGRAHARNRRIKGRPFVSHLLVLALARLRTLGRGGARLDAARAWMAGRILSWIDPALLFVIDESGSAQPFVQAARARRIPVIGVQHGDCGPGNPQYDASLMKRTIEPVDVLCLWSPWFRERLLNVSRIYDRSTTRVVGRLRYPPSPAPPGDDAREEATTRVLFLGEAGLSFRKLAQPFVDALSSHPALEVRLRPHPGEGEPRGSPRPATSLDEDLTWCDAAVGMRSSALLEAVFRHRPVVLCASDGPPPFDRVFPDPPCSPEELPERVLDARNGGTLQPGGGTSRKSSPWERIWGGAPADPVGELKRIAQELTPRPPPFDNDLETCMPLGRES
jgi:hypothetical protein